MDSYRWFWRKQRVRMGRMGCVFSLWNHFLAHHRANPSSACHFSLIPWQGNFLVHTLALMCPPKRTVLRWPWIRCWNGTVLFLARSAFWGYDSGILMVHGERKEGCSWWLWCKNDWKPLKFSASKGHSIQNTECMLCWVLVPWRIKEINFDGFLSSKSMKHKNAFLFFDSEVKLKWTPFIEWILLVLEKG